VGFTGFREGMLLFGGLGLIFGTPLALGKGWFAGLT
jgi:hypothetical protein